MRLKRRGLRSPAGETAVRDDGVSRGRRKEEDGARERSSVRPIHYSGSFLSEEQNLVIQEAYSYVWLFFFFFVAAGAPLCTWKRYREKRKRKRHDRELTGQKKKENEKKKCAITRAFRRCLASRRKCLRRCSSDRMMYNLTYGYRTTYPAYPSTSLFAFHAYFFPPCVFLFTLVYMFPLWGTDRARGLYPCFAICEGRGVTQRLLDCCILSEEVLCCLVVRYKFSPGSRRKICLYI